MVAFGRSVSLGFYGLVGCFVGKAGILQRIAQSSSAVAFPQSRNSLARRLGAGEKAESVDAAAATPAAPAAA
jgi:hypothetical protein